MPTSPPPATTSATETARTLPLIPGDRAAPILRALQDAALATIDPAVASRLRQVDTRFDRTVRDLRHSSTSEAPTRRDPDGSGPALVGALGAFLSVGAALTSVDAGRHHGGWTQEPAVLAPSTVALLLAACIAHAAQDLATDEARTLLGSLAPTDREALDTAVREGVRAVVGRRVLRPAAAEALRSADAAAGRYDVVATVGADA